MAIILDYDEETLRGHMERRGLPDAVISSKIKEFKSKTLPSAKYFDDRKMLHLVRCLLYIIVTYILICRSLANKMMTRSIMYLLHFYLIINW